VRLHSAGWTPVRIWEHEDPEAAANEIAKLVRSAGSRSTFPRDDKG
jgi:DNA mismatch endonuclease (patch repair protein)